MNSRELRAKWIGDSWTRLLIVALLGIGGGGAGTTLLAQPRTDEEIRTIASREVSHERRVTDEKFRAVANDIREIKEDIDDINGGIEEVLRRLPR